MSMCEKDQVELPRSSADSDIKLGGLRLQSYNNKDEIHIHDDKENKIFVMKDKRRFQLGMSDFIKNSSQWMEGVKYVVKGDNKPSKGKACNLILELLPDGWSVELRPVAEHLHPEDHYVFLCDPIIHILDEFVQRL